MKYRIEARTLDVDGKPFTTNIAIVTLENGEEIIAEEFKPNSDELMDYWEKEFKYFLENESDFITKEINKAKEKILDEFSKGLDAFVSKDRIVNSMYENAYGDYVPYGASYEEGIRMAFFARLNDATNDFNGAP